MPKHEKIDYVELPARDIQVVQQFFNQVFGWEFEDYGPDYCAFSNQGLDGGFYRADMTADSATGGALIVFYSNNLEQTLAKIEAANGLVIKPVFAFPGGRRFHFSDPNGNEYAVWSDH